MDFGEIEATLKKTEQNEQTIIDNIIEELNKKRDIAIHKKKKALFKDDVAIYRLEEDTIDMFFLEFVN